jgi:hypothetical protein
MYNITLHQVQGGYGMGMAVVRKENSHSNIGSNASSNGNGNINGNGIFSAVTGKQNYEKKCGEDCTLYFFVRLLSILRGFKFCLILTIVLIMLYIGFFLAVPRIARRKL